MKRYDTRPFESGTITVHQGLDHRVTTLYRKSNGQFVYWSPFTGERVVIRRPIKRLFHAAYIRKLEERLRVSRRLPYKDELRK